MRVVQPSNHCSFPAVSLLVVAILTVGCGGSTTSSSVVGPAGTRCAVSVTNDTPEVAASGGNGSLTVTAARECSWAASTEASWIRLGVTGGQGAATLNYSVSSNPIGTARRGRVVVAEQSVDITQAAAPCRYEISPATLDVDASRHETSVRLAATDGCRWAGRSGAAWIGNPAPADGTGSATVRIAIEANTGPVRIGTLTLGEANVRINQSGPNDPAPPGPQPTPPAPPGGPPPNCSYTVTPTRIAAAAAGEQVAIDVAAPGACTWTASTTTAWIKVAPGAGTSGNGSVRAEVDENPGNARTGSITVANRTVTIEQAARSAPSCSYRLEQTRRSVGRGPDAFAVGINAPPGCEWTVSREAPWISVVDGHTGSGIGSFRLAVEANGGRPRAGTVRVATQTFTVEQEGSACSYSIKPDYYNAGRGPDNIVANVTADSGCAWTTETNADWVTVESGRSGSGNGVVRLLIPANRGPARNTLLTIAGHTFTLTQAGTCDYSIKPDYYNAGRGPDTILVNVTADSRCAWTTETNADWVTAETGRSGSGNGTVRLVIPANSGPARNTLLTIAGHTFTLTQAGSCDYSIKPRSWHSGRGPDDIRIDVTADPGCTWSAESSVSWVRVEGRTGSGNGVVRLLVQPNSGPERSVTLTIAGQPFKLRQNAGQ